jgi:transcription elongation factor/antiterminator RfaH
VPPSVPASEPTGRVIALKGGSDQWDSNGDSLPGRSLGRRKGKVLNQLNENVANGVSPNSSWYALQVRSRKESYVASQIQGQGFECLLPTYKNIRKWSDRVKELEQPLFPGYLFCRFDFQNRRPVVTTPGVLQIVGFGRTAIPVPDDEIQALQLALTSGMPKQPWPYLEVGQRVRVIYGTLTGLEGILVNVKGNHRVVLSVSLLQRSVAMEVETSWLSPVKEESREGITQRILRPIRVQLGS